MRPSSYEDGTAPSVVSLVRDLQDIKKFALEMLSRCHRQEGLSPNSLVTSLYDEWLSLQPTKRDCHRKNLADVGVVNARNALVSALNTASDNRVLNMFGNFFSNVGEILAAEGDSRLSKAHDIAENPVSRNFFLERLTTAIVEIHFATRLLAGRLNLDPAMRHLDRPPTQSLSEDSLLTRVPEVPRICFSFCTLPTIEDLDEWELSSEALDRKCDPNDPKGSAVPIFVAIPGCPLLRDQDVQGIS